MSTSESKSYVTLIHVPVSVGTDDNRSKCTNHRQPCSWSINSVLKIYTKVHKLT